MADQKREEDKETSINSTPLEEDADTAHGASGDPATGDPRAEILGAVDAATAGELKKMQAEKAELLQTLIRRQADYENFRKRMERERHEEGRRGVERLINDLIPVLDAFDRALQGHGEDPAYEEYRKGVTLIRKQLWDTLARHGLERIEASGRIFDPHLHQALERVETLDCPDGSIVEVFQDGYMFHGRVLRPAIVRVAVHPAAAENLPASEN